MIECFLYIVFFFFKQKTAYEMRISDWSSDVCSSDLRAVIGAEGEISGSTGKVTNETVDTDALGYGRVKAGRDLYLGVRAGFKATPATLIYAKGGYTNQRLDLIAGDEDSETGEHFNLDGYRLGAGVEQKVGSNAYAKAERSEERREGKEVVRTGRSRWL